MSDKQNPAISTGLKGAAKVANGTAVAVDKSAMEKPRKRGRGKGGQRGYVAASQTGAQQLWLGTRGDANYDIQLGLESLRAKSRDAYQNEAYAHDIVDTYVDLLISTGIKPTPDTGDAALNDRAWLLWEKWGKNPVAGMPIDIYGAERLIARHIVMDGEGLARFRVRRPDDMPGVPPLKLQLLEADLLPITKTEKTASGGKIISGVEFDAIGEIVAYHLLKDHPGSSMSLTPFVSNYDTSRIPASNVIHAYDAFRAGQVRGVPWLAPILLTIKNFHDLLYSVQVAIHAISTLAFIVEGGDSSDPIPGINAVVENGDVLTDADGQIVEEMTPGLVAYAPDGKTISKTVPQMPTGIKELVSTYLHEMAAAIGLSYHTVSGDMSDSSFAQAKLGLIHEAVHLACLRELMLIPMVLNPIWKRFIDEAIIARMLPNDPRLYSVRWTSPKIPAADESTEVKTAVMKMQAGLDSRDHIIEAAGLDPDTVTAAIAADNAKCDSLGLTFLGDLRKVTMAGMNQITPPPETTTES